MTLADVNKMNRNQALRFILWQVIAVACIALSAGIAWGWSNTKSLSLGGLTAVVPTLYFAHKFFRKTGALAASEITRRFYRAEMGKITLTALLFLVIIKCTAVSFLPFFMGYIVAQSVYWFWLK